MYGGSEELMVTSLLEESQDIGKEHLTKALRQGLNATYRTMQNMLDKRQMVNV